MQFSCTATFCRYAHEKGNEYARSRFKANEQFCKNLRGIAHFRGRTKTLDGQNLRENNTFCEDDQRQNFHVRPFSPLLPMKKYKKCTENERGSFPRVCISISNALAMRLSLKSRNTNSREFRDPGFEYQNQRAYRGKGHLISLQGGKRQIVLATPAKHP